MTIGSLLRAAVIISIGLAAILSWFLFSTFEQVNRATERGTVADEIVQGTLTQNIVTSDYLLHREERAKTLWTAKYGSLTDLIGQAERAFKSSKEQADLDTIREDHESSQAVFAKLVTTSETQASGSEEIAKSQALQEGLAAQLLLKSQEMVSAASQLAERSREQIDTAQKRAQVFVVAFLVIMAVMGVAMLAVLSRKVLRPITQLQRGAQIIGAGDLDYRTGITSRDEIGGLSRAFDQMTENLKAITASREELEREVTERRRVESALRESEERYRSLYGNTPVMMHEIDSDGCLTNVNDYWLEVLGYERGDVIGKPIPIFMTEAPRRYAAEEVIPRVFKTGHVEDIEYQFVKKNGEVIDVLLSAISEWDTSTRMSHALAFVVDVTERKRAEEMLLQQTEELAVVGERGRLAREIHDTLAQSFTGIIWQLNAAAQTVAKGGEKAVDSLGSVRDLAREGLQQARRSVWDLRAGPLEGRTLSEALNQETEKVLSGGEIRASYVLSGEETVLPSGVEAALLRICQESLTNIIKHASASQVGVTLAFDDTEVRLSVQDDGVGFDPEAPKHRGKDRSGFGLISRRERARILGGELKVQSEPGRGTLVEATLSLS